MELSKSDIIISTAGRDRDLFFYVLDRKDDRILIANGKERTLEHPKWKKQKHVRRVARSEYLLAVKIRRGERVLNSELRRDLAIFRQDFKSHNQGGY